MGLARLQLIAGLIVLFGLSVAGIYAAMDPAEIVRKSQNADKYVSYRGLKYADITIDKKTVRAHFKIVHRKPDHTRTEYFQPAELAGIISIDKGSDSWRYLPAQQKWQHNKWELAPQRIDLALKNYNAVSAGKEKICGRSAYVIKLIPKKKGNPSETIWVDDKYFLVLKSELRNSSGTPVSVSAFREISFEPTDIKDSAFAVPVNVKPPNNPVPDLGFKVVKPKYIPKGYSFVQTTTVPVTKDVYAAHLMYTNGINTISIFERKRDKNSDKWDDRGNMANVVRFDHGQVTFTIIGDISKAELQKIANSLK
ncbi:MAG TPA: MucB/RseB C-terminal domain-containing protein [Armatimonadota bacterium]|nr:MucB/RseB C-terminal domain-containing protein [Armatimonadota bacterium]HPP75406.1 MucB/RseB C-terminal domain-containing protein [Armatimonadota bacterium]